VVAQGADRVTRHVDLGVVVRGARRGVVLEQVAALGRIVPGGHEVRGVPSEVGAIDRFERAFFLRGLLLTGHLFLLVLQLAYAQSGEISTAVEISSTPPPADRRRPAAVPGSSPRGCCRAGYPYSPSCLPR